MKISIIAAMKHEAKILLSQLNDSKKVTMIHPTVSGIIGKKEVTVTLSGPGKVSAAAATQQVIDKFNPDIIINIGISGGLASSLKTGDVVISNKFIQYDFNLGFRDKGEMWNPSYNSELLETEISDSICVKNLNYIMGTGDKFIDSRELKAKLVKNYNIDCCDMESGAIAQICHLNSVPFITIRGISDSGEGTGKEFGKAMKLAIKNSTSELLKLLT